MLFVYFAIMVVLSVFETISTPLAMDEYYWDAQKVGFTSHANCKLILFRPTLPVESSQGLSESSLSSCLSLLSQLYERYGLRCISEDLPGQEGRRAPDDDHLLDCDYAGLASVHSLRPRLPQAMVSLHACSSGLRVMMQLQATFG
jgi:hypothetical protein